MVTESAFFYLVLVTILMVVLNALATLVAQPARPAVAHLASTEGVCREVRFNAVRREYDGKRNRANLPGDSDRPNNGDSSDPRAYGFAPAQ